MKVKSDFECDGGDDKFIVNVSKKDDKLKKAKKNSDSQKVMDREDMKEYFNKLQELVPFMPKNKKLSKLSVISYAIDYIHELRKTLGLPPCQVTGMDDCSAEGSFSLSSTPQISLSLVRGEMDSMDHQEEVGSPSFHSAHPTSGSRMSGSTSSMSPPAQRQPLTPISSPRNSSE